MSFKIVLIGPIWPYRGGISHDTAVLANQLSAAGHDVRVISFKRQYPQWLYPGITDRDNSQQPLKMDAEYLLDPFNMFSWFKTAARVKELKPDLVAIQWWITFWGIPLGVLARLIIKQKIKVVYMIHNVLPHEEKPWDRILAKFALSATQNYFVHSESQKLRLLTIFPDANISLAPLSIFTVAGTQRIPKSEARKHLGLVDDAHWLLFFGFIRPYKGLPILLDALRILKPRGILPHLLIAGEFWQDKQHYLDMIQEYSLSDQVIVMDRYIPNEEVLFIYSAVDVLVMPYLEGATQSGVASMAIGYGLPIIMSEFVAQGLYPLRENADIVVPPGNVVALANALEEFLSLEGGTIPQPASTNNQQLVTQALLRFLGVDKPDLVD
jgi:glycosyltransferase involved in cell wall biosynthesis